MAPLTRRALVKFGATLYGTDPDYLVAAARRAEELEYESLWRGEHVVLPATFDGEHYPYTTDGVPPIDVRAPIVDPLVLFSFLAAVTTRIRFATGIYLLPLRHPLVVARLVGTVDALSRGRLVLGVGVGWLRSEFEALGVPFVERAARVDEAIAVLRLVWSEPEPSFTGRHVAFDRIRFEPKPVGTSPPPIVIGGESKAALARAAALGDGWYGHPRPPEAAAVAVDNLRRLRAQAGQAAPLEITMRTLPGISVDDVRRYEEAGVDRLVLEVGGFSTTGPGDLSVIERFAADVIARM